MKMYQSIFTASVLIMLLTSLSFLISKKSTLDINKTSPFECGFSNFSSSRMSFSIHFFMIAVIFLMFDIEIAIMMPTFVTLKMMKISQWFSTSTLLATLITYGLYHEWINGIIEWSK